MGDSRFTVYCVILCVTVGVCYWKALDCGFAFDDISAIKDNKDLRPKTPIYKVFLNDFWGTPMHQERSHKSYRPLCVLTFRFNYWLHELDTMGYHLLNVILHGIVCIMFMRMCMMFLQELPSFVAAMLFAVHPIHTEAVTGTVGRAEALSSIFFIASLMVYSKCTGYHKKTNWAPLLLTIVLVTIAMLCKEQGITVIGVCVVYELFVAQRALFADLWSILMGIVKGKPDLPNWLKGSIVRSAVLVGSTLFLLIARIKVMGAQLPVFTNFDNPASTSPTPDRQLTYNYLLPVNFWLLLFPSNLCCDWTMGTISVLKFADARNLITIMFYACFVKIVHFCLLKQSRINRALIMSLALMVLPFIPASNLFFPVGFVVAERILYTPSMGFCMLVAVGFDVILEHKKEMKSLLWMLMGFLLVTHALKTFTRNIEWTSEYSLFRAGLKVNRNNAKLFNNVGHALEKDANWAEALKYFNKAVSVQPDDIGAHMNVGRTYKNLQMFDEALLAYDKAKDLFPPVIPGKSYMARVAPTHLNVFLNLATLYIRDPSRLQEADKLLETATDMRPDYIQGYINRGDIQIKMGNHMKAIELYQRALHFEPDNADVHYNLGVVHMDIGQRPKAMLHFEDALKHDSDHWQALYNSGVLIQEDKVQDRWPVAAERFLKLMKMNESDSRPPFSMSMLAMDMADYIAAEKYLKLTLEAEPTFKSALFNLPLMLTNNLKKPGEAVPYVRKLLELYPDHAKGIMLLGELNVNFLKNLEEAEQCFTTVLKINPDNIEAMHNLCVVYVEKGQLWRAEECLAKVHHLAPKEEYIYKHLMIVKQKIQEYNAMVKAKAEADKAQTPASEGQTQGQGQAQGQTQNKGQAQGQTQNEGQAQGQTQNEGQQETIQEKQP